MWLQRAIACQFSLLKEMNGTLSQVMNNNMYILAYGNSRGVFAVGHLDVTSWHASACCYFYYFVYKAYVTGQGHSTATLSSSTIQFTLFFSCGLFDSTLCFMPFFIFSSLCLLSIIFLYEVVFPQCDDARRLFSVLQNSYDSLSFFLFHVQYFHIPLECLLYYVQFCGCNLLY